MSTESDDRFSNNPPSRRRSEDSDAEQQFRQDAARPGRGQNEERDWDREDRRGRDEESSSMGSLAQSARLKELNSARWALIIVGVLVIGVNIFEMVNLRSLVREAFQKEIRNLGPGAIVDQAQLRRLEDSAVRIGTIIGAGAIVLGVVFLILGLLVRRFPVPITITGLVLFLIYQGALIVLDINNLYRGIILKVIVLVVLVKAIQAAFAYQKDAVAQTEPAYE